MSTDDKKPPGQDHNTSDKKPPGQDHNTSDKKASGQDRNTSDKKPPGHDHTTDELERLIGRIKKGGAPKYHEKNAGEGKLFARDRIRLLCDDGAESFVEDGLLANNAASDLPADGVITGIGRVHGRPVAIMANDSTVKAGSWGARTVEKIVRIQEVAGRHGMPLIYLVDSAGARITDQLDMFPGRRHAGRIFYTEVQLSGAVPQICLLFGPSAAGGAYIPAFCDVVFMVDKNASMYLGSPRMAEMVIGEKVTLEEMGGGAHALRGVWLRGSPGQGRARVHCQGARLSELSAAARGGRAATSGAAPGQGGAQAHRRDHAGEPQPGVRYRPGGSRRWWTRGASSS